MKQKERFRYILQISFINCKCCFIETYFRL